VNCRLHAAGHDDSAPTCSLYHAPDVSSPVLQ